MVLAFVTVSAAFGDSALRGLTALALGLTLGLVGIDLQTGQARLSFGIPDLLDGIEVTTLAVALFAIGEALKVAAAPTHLEEKIEPVKGSVWMSRADWARSWKPWLRGTLIGFPIGAMPAGGAEIGTFLSYSTEKALTKHPEEFGHGAIEGVAGPGGRQQRLRRRHAGAAPHPRPADERDRGDHARRLPAVRPAAGAAALRHQRHAGVEPDRLAARRQPDAARAQPAAGRALGAAARHPAAVALRRHPDLRDARHHRRQPLAVRARHAARSSACSATACAATATRSRRWWSA